MVVTIFCNFRDYCDEVMRKYWVYTNGPKYADKTMRLLTEKVYPKIGNLCMRDVKTSNINKILTDIIYHEGTSGACETRKVLLKVFNYAQEHRIVGKLNPVTGAINFPAPVKLMRYFNMEEETRIFDASKTVTRGIVAKIALKYGLCEDRLLAVRTDDLDRKKMVVNITKKVTGSHGLFSQSLGSESQHIYVDEQGMRDFESLVESRIKKDQIQCLEYGMRFQTGIPDFSLKLCKQTFIMDAIKSGATPVDLRAYYSTKGTSDFFYYLHHIGEDAADERIYRYLNEQT